MADDDKDDKGTEEDAPELDDDAKGDGEEDETEEDKAEDEDPEVTKLKKRAARRDRELRKAQAELAELRKAGEKKDEPDPIAVANTRLVRSSARAILAAAGVTDKDDQRAVIDVLNLSDITVDDEDGPDEDEIEERISELRRILGGPAKSGGRVPKTVTSKDKGSSGSTQTDPDKARYARIMAGRRA